MAFTKVPATPGAMLTVAGTALTGTYTNGTGYSVGKFRRVRFWITAVLNAGSTITSVTVKLQQRYYDGTNATAWVDLPSYLDDVQGAAQPKGPTLEIEHVLSGLSAPVAAPGSCLTFVLADSRALHEVRVCGKASATGVAGDSLVVYGQAG